MRKVTVRRIVYDVGEGKIECLVAEFDRISLRRLCHHLFKEYWIDGGRFLADQPGKCGALSDVAFSSSTQAAVEVDLESCRLSQLVRWQLAAALVEIVGDPHWPNRVRTRRAGTDLVEFLEDRH